MGENVSKGSKRRPKQITQEELDKQWERVFKKAVKKFKETTKHHMNIEVK